MFLVWSSQRRLETVCWQAGWCGDEQTFFSVHHDSLSSSSKKVSFHVMKSKFELGKLALWCLRCFLLCFSLFAWQISPRGLVGSVASCVSIHPSDERDQSKLLSVVKPHESIQYCEDFALFTSRTFPRNSFAQQPRIMYFVGTQNKHRRRLETHIE